MANDVIFLATQTIHVKTNKLKCSVSFVVVAPTATGTPMNTPALWSRHSRPCCVTKAGVRPLIASGTLLAGPGLDSAGVWFWSSLPLSLSYRARGMVGAALILSLQ